MTRTTKRLRNGTLKRVGRNGKQAKSGAKNKDTIVPTQKQKALRPGLSKNLMRMKFMQRTAEDNSENENEQTESKQYTAYNDSAQHSGVLSEECWVIGELQPQQQAQQLSNDDYSIEIVEEPNYAFVCGQLWNRMSFSGFNRDVERLAKKYNEQLLRDTFGDVRTQNNDVDVDDLEMAAFRKQNSAAKGWGALEGSDDGECDSDDDDADEELQYATTERVDHEQDQEGNGDQVAAWSDEEEDAGASRNTATRSKGKQTSRGHAREARPRPFKSHKRLKHQNPGQKHQGHNQGRRDGRRSAFRKADF